MTPLQRKSLLKLHDPGTQPAGIVAISVQIARLARGTWGSLDLPTVNLNCRGKAGRPGGAKWQRPSRPLSQGWEGPGKWGSLPLSCARRTTLHWVENPMPDCSESVSTSLAPGGPSLFGEAGGMANGWRTLTIRLPHWKVQQG